MKNLKGTAMMMVMALVMGIMFCSCNAAGGSDYYEAQPQTSIQASESKTTVPAEDNGPKAKAVCSGLRLTFYYDTKDHAGEGTVYEVSSTGYNSQGTPWMNCGFIMASFDSSCQNWNPESLAYFFSNCTDAVSIDCKNLNTSCTTNMSRMFNNCTSLVSVDMRNLDTAKVEKIDCMFRHCTTLLAADLSIFSPETVSGSYGIFTGCNASVTY